MSIAGLCGLELALLEKHSAESCGKRMPALSGNLLRLQSPLAVQHGPFHSHDNILPLIAAFR